MQQSERVACFRYVIVRATPQQARTVGQITHSGEHKNAAADNVAQAK